MSRVLVVDDEPDVRELARISFAVVAGHHCDVAADGREALAALSEQQYDAVVMDVQMPELTGPATLAEMRSKGYGVPVVFLTASVREADLDALRELDIVGVLPKPFDPMTLADEVAGLMRWRL